MPNRPAEAVAASFFLASFEFGARSIGSQRELGRYVPLMPRWRFHRLMAYASVSKVKGLLAYLAWAAVSAHPSDLFVSGVGVFDRHLGVEPPVTPPEPSKRTLAFNGHSLVS
jgi:hypothetical protein